MGEIGHTADLVGGLAGQNEGTIIASYAIGNANGGVGAQNESSRRPGGI